MNKRQRKKENNKSSLLKVSKKLLVRKYNSLLNKFIPTYEIENMKNKIKELTAENEELKAKLNKPKTTRKKKVEEANEQ